MKGEEKAKGKQTNEKAWKKKKKEKRRRRSGRLEGGPACFSPPAALSLEGGGPLACLLPHLPWECMGGMRGNKTTSSEQAGCQLLLPSPAMPSTTTYPSPAFLSSLTLSFSPPPSPLYLFLCMLALCCTYALCCIA